MVAVSTVYKATFVERKFTDLQNVPENVCGHKSLRLSTTREIGTINGVQTMDLQYMCSVWNSQALPPFLSRVSILTRDIDIAYLSVCPSVCPSVRLSVTFRYQMKTA